jgi:hypothetical protein
VKRVSYREAPGLIYPAFGGSICALQAAGSESEQRTLEVDRE